MLAPGLLDGVRVIDFSIWRPGPYATQLLAEMGATVVKVEPPGGDPMRRFTALFAELNALKQCRELDLKQEADRATALALVAGADVVVEGYRPGVAARLGIDAATLRRRDPRLVHCSISGFGQTGPLHQLPGHDINYQALGGTLAPDGGTPVAAAVPLADLASGMAAAMAICAALVRRARTDEGETIDCAMADVMAGWTGAATPDAAGIDPDQRGVPGYGVFATADGGHVALGIIDENHFWRALCGALGLDALAGLSFAERAGSFSAIQAAITAAIEHRERDALVAELAQAGVPVTPVLDRAGMLAHPALRARGVTSADGTVGHPVRYQEHPARRAGRTEPAGPPATTGLPTSPGTTGTTGTHAPTA